MPQKPQPPVKVNPLDRERFTQPVDQIRLVGKYNPQKGSTSDDAEA